MCSIKTSSVTRNIMPINAFFDNYIWAITSIESSIESNRESNIKSNTEANKNTAALVDPGDAAVCIAFLEKNHLSLSTILITHHHPDHTGGIKELMAYCQQKQWPLTIYGPANENIPHCDVKLAENDVVNLATLNVNFQVIDLPGHTAGHIAYFANDSIEPVLFCGDTLFSGGCGRLFEGSAEQMLNSLTKLTNLPENTKVYCAHEYTQANLKFALAVEPKNEALKNYSNKVNELRRKKLATIPTSIKVEQQINPFLRSDKSAVQTSAAQFDSNTQTTALATFTTIRRWKDQF